MEVKSSRLFYRKTNSTASVVLRVVAVAGLLSLAMVAPNAVQLLKILDSKKRSDASYRVKKVISKLQKQGLVEVKNEIGEKFLALTPSGERWLERERIKQELTSVKKRRWDGCWHVVMFDIKEWSRRKRDLLRLELQDFGFIKLQNSVWVTPYDCEKIVELLKVDLELGRDVLYLRVKEISEDKQLRIKFGLS